jgi:hypothetical protein
MDLKLILKMNVLNILFLVRTLVKLVIMENANFVVDLIIFTMICVWMLVQMDIMLQN